MWTNIDWLSCKDQYKTPIKTYKTEIHIDIYVSAATVQFMIQNQGMKISSKWVNYIVICYTVNLKPDFSASRQYWFDWTLVIYRIPHTKFHLKQHAWRLISHYVCSQSAGFLPLLIFGFQIGCLSPISEVNRYGFW